MKDKRCFICKYLNSDSEHVEHSGTLYGHSGETMSISLCWSHSVKLFKVGQFNFFENYLPIIKAQHGQHRDERILRDFGIFEHQQKVRQNALKDF